jgi:hypothetical protein
MLFLLTALLVTVSVVLHRCLRLYWTSANRPLELAATNYQLTILVHVSDNEATSEDVERAVSAFLEDGRNRLVCHRNKNMAIPDEYEVLEVRNGSSYQMVPAERPDNHEVVCLPHKTSKWNALWYGVREAKGCWIFVADYEHLEFLQRLSFAWEIFDDVVTKDTDRGILWFGRGNAWSAPFLLTQKLAGEICSSMRLRDHETPEVSVLLRVLRVPQHRIAYVHGKSRASKHRPRTASKPWCINALWDNVVRHKPQLLREFNDFCVEFLYFTGTWSPAVVVK